MEKRSALRFLPSLLFSLLALLGQLAGAAQSKLPSAKEVVTPTAYVSLVPVPRGRAFQLAIVLKIRPGFHINARKASLDYLIPTDLQATPPAGFRAGAAVYPRGKLRKFQFSPDQPLNVYEDTAVIRLPLTALADSPLGPQRVPLKLRYQACSEEVCLPPVTLGFEAAFDVAAAGARAMPARPELFSK